MTEYGRVSIARMTCGRISVSLRPERGSGRTDQVSNAHSELAKGFVEGCLLVRRFPALADYEGALELVGAGWELSGAGSCDDHGARGDAAPVDDLLGARDVDDPGRAR